MPGIARISQRLLLVCCLTSACGGGGTSITASSEPVEAEPIPELAELEAIESPSLIAFPGYSFSSTMPGQIVVGGSCSSLDAQAVEGNNTIRMNNLAPGDYLDCTIQVRSNAGKLSEALQVSNFTVALPEAIAFTALVGENDSVITFEPTAEGFDFYTSAEINCDLDNYTSCDAAELSILNNEPVTISTLQHNRTAYFSLQKSNIRSQELAVSIKDKNSRLGKQNVVFNGQVWEVGGLEDDGQMLNDVWSITDGKYWAEHTGNAEFSARYDHQLKVFNGEMWLVGGLSVDGLENDVWRSSDGVNWELATASAEFSPRRGHQLVVFSERLWVIGGEDSTGKLGDVWSSENGVSWRLESTDAPFGPRVWHTVIEHADQLYIAGGEGIEEHSIWRNRFPTASNFNNGWWRSNNGVDWELIDANQFSNSKYVALVVAGGKLRHAGDKENNELRGPPDHNDVISTWDGDEWSEPNTGYFLNSSPEHNSALEFKGELWLLGKNIRFVSELTEYDSHRKLAPYFPRSDQAVAKFDEQIWVLGGTSCCSSGDGDNHYDVWSSNDGIEWTERERNLQVSLGGGANGIEFSNKLWAFAGYSQTPGPQISGWTADGVTWTPFAIPYGYNITRFDPLVFRNRLWIIGGFETQGTAANNKDQIWSMEDDGEWQLEAEGIEGFLPRVDYEAVVYNDQILVYGGVRGNAGQPWRDVWSSSDGIDWTKRADDLPFLSDPMDSNSISNELEITTYNELLWFVGRSGVWNSSDAINWVQVSENLPFSLHGDRMLTTLNGMLAHVGLHTWFSVDGVSWRRGVNGSLPLAD